jgi:hypothetical protein
MMYIAIIALLALLTVRIKGLIKDYKRMKALESIPYIDVETIG